MNAQSFRLHTHGLPLLWAEMLEHVLSRFEEVRQGSLIRRKRITLDTCEATVEETLADLVE